ncbi:MAG: ADP-ribosylation factor-like protein [Promethearchaeota archaeon]
MSNIEGFKKILFCGLESGGKTSILLLLDKKFSLLSTVKPTIKVKRTLHTSDLLGATIVRWDLGGQKSYRKIYLGNKSKYFTEMQSIFYVIDVQAPKKFEEALTFLKDIITITSESHLDNFQLIVLLHKYDPDIRKDDDVNHQIKNLENEIASIIKEVPFVIFRTSIYDEPSLLKAFSHGAYYATHKSKMFQTLLKDYMGKTYNSSALLLDQNGFIVASRSTEKSYQRICEAIAPRLAQALEKLEEWDINTIDIVTNVEFPEQQSGFQKEAIIFLRKLDIDDIRLYLVALCLNKKVKTKSYEYLPLLADNLKTLLESFD